MMIPSKFIKSKIIATACLSLLTLILTAQPEQVQFRTIDKVPVTADLYAPNSATAPFIVLFHQAKYSRGEYSETAPLLNDMGFNCLAVDLRSGGSINGVPNKTFNYADSLHMKTRYIDAYSDMRAAVSFARKKYPNAKIILFGSSYSASLSIKMACDFPTGISGVVAFSPNDNFSKYGWAHNIIAISAGRVKCPVFITSAQEEKDSWQGIYDAIPVQTKVAYIPQAYGKHGSKALWKIFPENTEYWVALKKFLAQFK